MTKQATRMTTAFLGLAIHATPAIADAGPGGSRASSFLIETIVMLIVAALVFLSIKVYLSIRGGKVGAGWLWLMGGFGVWCLGQAAFFCGEIGIIPAIGLWLDVIRIVALALVLVAMLRFRKLFA
ncbi:MAG TPA: hypothetical protein VGB22_02930 [candidate division Zixibacteria bacterium]